jgi:hypothetical protein
MAAAESMPPSYGDINLKIKKQLLSVADQRHDPAPRLGEVDVPAHAN